MRRTILAFSLLCLIAGPAPAAPLAKHAMVAAANPLAAQAGLKVLREGGNAVDAAVAIQSVLGLVEPQSSGLGAAPSWSTTTPKPARSPPMTGARPRRWARRRTCS